MYFVTALISHEHLVALYPIIDQKLRSRTFGFFESFEDAHAAVTDNVGNLHECLYDYIVIEKIGPGIHALCEEEHWYEWSETLNCWQPRQKPSEFNGLVTFSVG